MLIENQTDSQHYGPQAHFESKIIEVNESEEDKSSKQGPKLLIQDENSQYISGISLMKSKDFEDKEMKVEDQIQALLENNRQEMTIFANQAANNGRNADFNTVDTALEQTIAPARTAIGSARSMPSQDQNQGKVPEETKDANVVIQPQDDSNNTNAADKDQEQ